jgi:hypothetical protein
MNASFKHFFNACQPEFKSLHGVSWEVKPELYYQYLQTRYLAMIAEGLKSDQPTATGSLKSDQPNLGGLAPGNYATSTPPFTADQPEEETKPTQKQEKEHIET